MAMHYNHLRLLLFITVGFCCRATAEESNSARNSELSVEQIFCIQDVISSTPNVNKAKVDQVLSAFANMHFGVRTVHKTAGCLDLMNFGLREKHTNLTLSQWNAALGGTAFIQHVQNMSHTEEDMSEFVQALESIVDLEQKANIDRIFGNFSLFNPFAARWYLFSMAVKNSLTIDPTPFYALLHGDPNNTLCSDATIAERYGNREKVGNMTEAEMYMISFDFARYAPLVDMNKVREYVKIFAKGYFFTTPNAPVTVTQSDAVLELMYVQFVRSTTNLTLSEWKTMFKTKESDSVINIFADRSLTNSNLTTYKERFEKVLPSEETDGVFEMLTNLSKYEKNEVRSVAGVIGFPYKAMLDLNNVIPCWKVKNGIPYGHPGDYCVNKKLYCNANLDKNSLFYHDEFCTGNVV